ncbi:MAG: penicillin acylase family protein, partial [Actinobacteria bacterium]
LELYKSWGFKDGRLSSDADHVAGAASSESPAPGVRIVHDSAGIPHVFADGPDEQTIEERLAFGIGYAHAEDRLFQMEVFRRAGEGRLADLLGRDYLEMDVTMRRDVETDAERRAQIESMLTPPEQRSLQRYADGVNAVIQRDELDPRLLPAGFALTTDLPIAPWTVSDSVAISILETKAVAESAGNELGYGSLARRLAARYGLTKAAAILNDVQLTGDPLTPVTIPSSGGARRTTAGKHWDFVSYAPADTVARIASLPAGIEAADREVRTGDQAIAQATKSLGLPHFGSNAWAIAPSKTTTGHAILWGAPQVSYYVPPPLQEMEIVGGLTHARGIGVPGAGPALVIGYNPHVAWSLTSSQDDQVDTYIDRIRRAPGGAGFEYFWRGAWRPVAERKEIVHVRTTTPASTPLVGEVPLPVWNDDTFTFYRTFHGPAAHPLPCVVSTLDVDAGLAYCKTRSFWNTELGTGLAVVGAAQATNLTQFDAAVRKSVAGFNFIYADDAGHIAYWHTGTMPVRVRGHDPRLPVPGDGSFDWRGFLPPSEWPSVVDPAQGWIANWNNKPQASWPDAGDGTIWGTTQRARQPMSLLAAGAPFDLAHAWGVARRTGELDLSATLGFKPFLTSLLSRSDLTPVERAAVQQVAAWDGTSFYPGGAERSSSGGETGNVTGAGFPIFDAWFAAMEARVGRAVFEPATGDASTARGVRFFTQIAGTLSPRYEFFDDYDQFLFDALSGRASAADYLGGATVAAVSRAALDDAIATLSAAQGPDPAAWRASMPQISFMALDVGTIGTIPWENRGTYGQAVAFGR